MGPTPRSTGRPGWLVAGVVLTAIGGATCLLKAERFLASAPGPGPVGFWSLVMAVLGVAGLRRRRLPAGARARPAWSWERRARW